MTEAVKIVVIVEGGIVQDVLTAGVPVEYVIVDYDVDGYEEARIVNVPQDHGSEEGSVTAPLEAELNGPFVLWAHTLDR